MPTYKVTSKSAGKTFTINSKTPKTPEELKQIVSSKLSPQPEEQAPSISPSAKPSLWSGLGAEITPDMEQSHPYLSAIAKTGQQAFTVPAHYFNQALFELPRALTENAGYSYPEVPMEENKAASLASRGAGIAGALTGGPAKVLTKSATKIFPRLAGPGVMKAVGRGAISAGLTGAAYTPRESDIPILAPKERLQQGLAGAAIGAVAEPFIAGHQAYNKYAKEIGDINRKVPVLQNELSTMKNVGEDLNYNLGQRARKVKSILGKETGNLGRTISKLEERVNRVPSGKIEEVQNKAFGFFKNSATKFKSDLDNIATDIGEISSNQINEIGKKLNYKLRNDYVTQGQVKNLADALENAENGINFKQLWGDIRAIKSPSPTDMHAEGLLHDTLSEVLGKNYQSVRDLQTAYRPVMKAREVLWRKIQPSGGREDSAAKFLIKMSKGELSRDEVRYLTNVLGESPKTSITGRAIKTASKNLETTKQRGKEISEKIKDISIKRNRQLSLAKRSKSEEIGKAKETLANVGVNMKKTQDWRRKLAYLGIGAASLSSGPRAIIRSILYGAKK